MFIIKNIDYKKYTVKIWEQRPTLEQGSHGYEVFNPKGISIFYDDSDMWDENACYQNAIEDINVDLERG